MDEAFYAFFNLNKCAVGNKIGNPASNALTGRKTLLDLVPRIFLGLLQSQGDALFFLVDVQHDDFQLLPDLQ